MKAPEMIRRLHGQEPKGLDHHIALDVLEKHPRSRPFLEREAAGKEPTLEHAVSALHGYLRASVSTKGFPQRNVNYYLTLLRKAREPAPFHGPSPLYDVLLADIAGHSARLIKLASNTIPPEGMPEKDFRILKVALRELYSTDGLSASTLLSKMEAVRRFLTNEPIIG